MLTRPASPSTRVAGGGGEGGKVIEVGNTRGIRDEAGAGRWLERKTGGQRNGDIRETRRHFIDLPRDAAATMLAFPSPALARAFPPMEIGFRRIEARRGVGDEALAQRGFYNRSRRFAVRSANFREIGGGNGNVVRENIRSPDAAFSISDELRRTRTRAMTLSPCRFAAVSSILMCDSSPECEYLARVRCTSTLHKHVVFARSRIKSVYLSGQIYPYALGYLITGDTLDARRDEIVRLGCVSFPSRVPRVKTKEERREEKRERVQKRPWNVKLNANENAVLITARKYCSDENSLGKLIDNSVQLSSNNLRQHFGVLVYSFLIILIFRNGFHVKNA